MASKELSILLLAKDMASKTIGKVSKEVGGLGKMSRTASRGLSSLAGNLAKLGAVAAVGLGVAVKSGLSSLAELESATTSVEGAITQMGLAGQVTGGQIATWANEIEGSIGAAFDDKAITQATSTLIRFGKLTPGNIRPAMEIIADLATKTGDVESAATLLAKALADPTKAAGKLARSGVILTKAQQAQIKAFTEAGDAASAQKVILDSLAETTKGAALASQGTYARAMSTLADVTEDAQRALAEGFLPVLEKVASKLSKALADPKVMANIREFGKGLASGLDSLIGIAEKLPWATIGDSLKIAGAGAKTVLGVFTAMPPWVQTAVLTGWGLNKLTGGALGSIVGQVASGVIKGVLGIQAGVVNVTGGVVNGPGGGLPGGGKGGPPLAPAAGGFALSSLLPAAAIAGVAAAAVGASLWLQEEGRKRRERGEAGESSAGLAKAGRADLAAYALWAEGARPLMNTGARPTGGGRGDASTAAEVKRLGEKQALAARIVAAGGVASASRIQAIMEKNVRATESGDTRVAGRIDSLNSAIRAIKIAPQITVPVYVTSTVSVRNSVIATQVRARYGATTQRRIAEEG